MSYKNIKATIDAIKAKVAAFGELTIEQKKKINYKFRLEWNFNSNSMEGNTLTIEETRSVMVGNLTVNDKPLKDVLEMQGHDQVIIEILRIGKGELRLSEKRICEIHKAIMHEDDETKKDKIGKWKQEPNMIYNHKGERYDFVSPEEVADRIHRLLDKTNAAIDAINANKKNAPHPIDVAMEFHLEYLDIHPFYDGNGRTARILTNLILISLGYNPFWINEKDRKIYYTYISDIQGYGGSKELFFEYCAGLIERSEQLVLNAIQGIDIEEEDDLHKEISMWKKQLVKKDEVFPQSNYAVAQIYQRTLKTLFTSFLSQMASFDELFTKKQITNHINSKHLKSQQLEHFDELFDDIINRSKLSKEELNELELKPIEGVHTIELKVYYSGFKNDGLNTFSTYSDLYVGFNEYSYVINDHGSNNEKNNFVKKLYSELLTEEEIKTIVKTMISKQFEKIKSSVKNQ
ncbi:Fic family protein [Flavobacterium rhamnosiphilum]|uniref:Fic family protein n=1 Tax=Flavobacterium rhamnosiphilum TaxID=2541724 RepID=A0A4R5FC87_9FLAO|nr:Fic family protein [Flavobacterium rhamnosiphilum]TDE46869.1 Fic family protein [Flavobacterium rhamnosiphilum]